MSGKRQACMFRELLNTEQYESQAQTLTVTFQIPTKRQKILQVTIKS